MNKSDKKRNTKFYVLITIFFIPLMISWLVYYYHDLFQWKTTNRGNLITPPVHFAVSDTNSTTLSKKWKIIFIRDEPCEELCKKTEHNLHQLVKALGKDHVRVKVITLHNKAGYPQLKAALQKKKEDTANKIYLVDPIDNLFMYYSSSVNPMDILKDLKKVLGASQIG